MSEERYKYFPNGEMTYDDRQISKLEAIEKLNDLENYRVKKNKEIAKFRKREEKYQSVISGMMSLIELYLNDELWWDKE